MRLTKLILGASLVLLAGYGSCDKKKETDCDGKIRVIACPKPPKGKK